MIDTRGFKMKRLLLCALLLACVGAKNEKSDLLFTTSFETLSVGEFAELKDNGLTFKSKGDISISSKFAKTGSKSLHIQGGEETVLEVVLPENLKSSRGVTFKAERWTSKNPFKLRVQAEVNGNWKEVANLDKKVTTGRGFPSHVAIKLPEEIIGGLKIICTAPAGKGVLIDDLKFHKGNPPKPAPNPYVATEKIRNILDSKALFVSGTENTHTFRIPAIITAPNGDLIASCDARRKSSADLIWVRDIDIVVKRSTDNGKTWTDMEMVCDFGDGRPASDPSFIVDKVTGEIFCFYNYMDQDNAPKEFRLWYQSSKDNGKTWSKPRDITDDISHKDWKMDFKFITSGRGIQTADGELLHTLVNLKRGLHLFGSKDHGKTWGYYPVPIKPANESKVIQLADNSLMINCRHNGKGQRYVHNSNDHGKSWEGYKDMTLPDPGCNGAILRYTSIKDGYKKNRLLFVNASSVKGRKNLSLRISYDEGKTWSKGKVIDSGPSAYSDITICKDGTIGILYEPGYKEVRFTRVSLEDLTDGEDTLSIPYKN